MRLSPLDAEHRGLGAHMGSFGGWDMPISYAGTVGEHTAVRTDCGIFDVSHLGKIMVRGREAKAFLEQALTNRISDLPDGKARYTLMLNKRQGIVDDMIVYAFDQDVMVVPNASNVDEVEQRLTQRGGGVEIAQTSDAILALQGPRSRAVLDAVVPGVPADLGYMTLAVAGPYRVARSGYTGEHGYEIFCDPADAPALWKSVLAEGVTPCGLAARDTLRLEMGYPLHGNDIDQDTTPAEAGILWAVRKELRETLPPPRKTLVGIQMTDRAIPRRGCAVMAADNKIGECTSGTFSPTLKAGIAMAYVEPGAVNVGDSVTVDVRGKQGAGVITDPPFVPSSPK